MCGCGCHLVADYARAVAENGAANGAPQMGSVVSQLDPGQSRRGSWRAWLVAKRDGMIATWAQTRAPADDRIEAV